VRSLAAIALGSNLRSTFGDREANLEEAIRLIRSLGEVTAVSSFYDTEPVGFLAQPRFLNAALLLETDLEPLALLRELLAVERAMGRERVADVLKGPRVIDLDLLLYFKRDAFKGAGFRGGVLSLDQAKGDEPASDMVHQDRECVVMQSEELVLPHPEMQRRRFVLEPLAEIAPEMVHPVSGLMVREMLARLDQSGER
jgi:2-amino-4-hydroxy-6-hydroxymethyldihydropteridine diphosphokinase